MSKKFVIYARKSTESKDRQVASIESQIDEMKKVAQRKNLKVVDIFTESQSASKLGRPVFAEMMQGVIDGDYSGILCWKPDRLARNSVDGGNIIWAMKKNDLIIQTIGQNYSADKDNMVMLHIHFGMAQKYTDDLSKNVKRGNLKKLKKGWLPGRAPLGYVNNKVDNTIELDPERHRLIRKLFDLILEGTPPQKARTMLNEEYGFRTPKKRRSGGNPLTTSTMYSMLKNKFYYGIIERKHDGEMRTFEGAHEPIITKKEYDRIQRILNSDNERQREYNFAYTGIINCAECGASITAYQKVKPSGKRYVYYKCTKKNNKTDCDQSPITGPQLHEQVARIVQQISLPEDLANWTIEKLQKLNEKDAEGVLRAKDSLEQEYNELGNQLEKLTDMLLKDLISEEEYKKRKVELENNRSEIKQKLDENKQNADQWFSQVETIINFAKNADTRFKTADIDTKGRFLKTLGDDIQLENKELQVDMHHVWKIFASGALSPKNSSEKVELPKNRQDKTKTTASAEAIPVWQG